MKMNRSILKHKILLIKLICLVILSLNILPANGQLFDSSQNPPNLKWRQINTEQFQILYPEGFEKDAQRMMNTVNAIIKRVSFSYQIKPRPITIILQNQGTSANGFVQLAPRKSEFYTIPSQNFDYQDWLNGLAVHELRHVVQFDKLTGKFRKPLFENLALAIFGITLPPWFYEGDAVDIETALTDAGRGRQPEWDIVLRTNTLSEKNFSYSKNYLGSAKDFTPGYYQLGYYMTAKLRRDNGTFIMDSLLARISHNILRPYNLSNSIRKYTGYGTTKLHDLTIAELKEKWQKQQDMVRPQTYPVLNKRAINEAVNYLLPAAAEDDKIIALKQGKSFAPMFVSIDKNGNEKQILKIGLQEDPNFNYAAEKLTWDEFRTDKRYQKRSFNVINVYNLKTKRYTQLTHHSRLFAPALSPDGTKIVAVEVSYSNEISLVELNASNGKELIRYQSPQNLMLQGPRYNGTGEKIVVVAVGQAGEKLYELTIKQKTFRQLTPFYSQLISKPVYAENNIIFKAHFNGIDNLYRLDLQNSQIWQLTSAKFGAFNPYYDQTKNRILFNNYHFNGFDAAYLDLATAPGIPLGESVNATINYIKPIVQKEGNSNVFDSIPTHIYQSKPYHEFAHLLNFHSALPIVEDNAYYSNQNFGIQLQSDNLLNTLSLYTGYRFNNALRKSEYIAGFNYSHFYPILNVEYTNQARLIYQKSSIINTNIPVSWRENVLEAKISVPFVFNQLNQTYNAGFSAGTSLTTRYNIINEPDKFIEKINFPMIYKAYLSRNSRTSARELAPKWGQNFSVTYRDYVFDQNLTGDLITFKSNLYFPGLWRNHSLQISFNTANGSGRFNSSLDIPKVSGYSYLKNTTALHNTVLTNYRFPIFYPDLELGPLAYIKRFRGGIFADFGNLGRANNYSPITYGAELTADMNLLRFYLPNFGVGGKLIFVNEKPNQKPIFETSFTYNY